MKNRRILLPALISIALIFTLILPASVLNTASVLAQGQVTPMVAAGYAHTVGVETDGTVVAVGNNESGQCDVGNWTGITQVAAGAAHTVGVKTDGTVVAAGWNDYGQCDVGGWIGISRITAGVAHNVGGWRGIVQVAAGAGHTVGLRTNGTVVAVGKNGWRQCDVGNWNLKLAKPINWPLIGGIIAVVAGGLAIFLVRRRQHA